MDEKLPLEFDEFRLHLTARELYRNGRLVALGPQVFDGLAWLLRHNERAVGRDELAAAVWGRTDVTDTQIDQLIRKIRRTLGDAGGEQRIIRTVPRFGYRWIAPTRAAEESRHATAPATPTDVQTSVRAHPRRAAAAWLAAGALVLALAIVVGRHVLASAESAAPTSGAQPSGSGAAAVAVLPVRIDEDTTEDWRWLRLGLMDLASARLREAGLRIVPPENVLALAEADPGTLDGNSVLAATGAHRAVDGEIRRTSLGWRMHVSLQDGNAVVYEAEAHAPDPMAATRDAVDRLLVTLDRPLKAPRPGVGTAAHEAWLHRIDAALYAHDLDNAQSLIDQARDSLPDDEHPEIVLRQAQVLRQRGDLEPARERYLDALAAPPQRLEARSRAHALLGLAVTEIKSGNAARGDELLAEAVAFTDQDVLADLHGMALANIAVLHTLRDEGDQAVDVFARARAALETAGDTLTLARLDANQAAALALVQKYAEASLLLDRAIERMRRFGPTETLASALGNRIHLDLALMQPAHALAVAEQADAMLGKVTEPRQRAILKLQQVRAFLANGRYAQARAQLAAVESTIGESDRQAVSSSLMEMKARLALAEGRDAEAIALAASAMDMAPPGKRLSAAPLQRLSALSLERLRALHRVGRLDEAAAEQARLAAWAAGSRDPAVRLHADVAAAEHARATGDVEKAGSLFRAALTHDDRVAVADRVDAILSWAGILISDGDLDEASRLVARITPWAEQCFDCSLTQARLYHELGQSTSELEALRSARRLAGERSLPSPAPRNGARLRLRSAAGTVGSS